MGRLVLNNEPYSGNENNGHLYGEEIPRASQGVEGSIYIQYTCTQTEDEEGYIIRVPDQIVCVYSKIDGEWIPFDEGTVPEDHGGYSRVIPNPAGAAVDPLVKVDIDGRIYSINAGAGTVVVPNPYGEPTGTLSTVKINNTIFGIDTGTDVQANPIGMGTESLTKLMVEDTIYDLPINTTEIEGNPEGEVTSGDLNKVMINGGIYSIPKSPVVTPNPLGGSIGVLTKLGIDGDVYQVGEEYSTVIPNPSGAATDNLNKISIDGDIYAIDNNVEANPVGTATDTLQTIEIDNTIYAIDTGNAVVANPQGIPTAELTSLEVDETIYSIPEIEANPQGTATVTLNTVEINGVIYDLSASGSGLGDLSDVNITNPINGQAIVYDAANQEWINGGVTFELPTGWTFTSDVLSVSGSLTEPNIYGWAALNDENYYEEQITFKLLNRSFTRDNALPTFLVAFYEADNDWYGYLHAISISTNATATDFSNNNQEYGPYTYKGLDWYYSGCNYSMYCAIDNINVTGINYLGNLTNMSREDIIHLVVDSADVQVITNLKNAVSNPNSGYAFVGGYQQSDYSDATFKVTTSGEVNGTDFKVGGSSILSTFTGSDGLTAGAKGMVPAPTASDNTKFLKGDGTWAAAGGSEVDPNPSGTATDTLSTIDIDGTIYDIPGTGTELPPNYSPTPEYLRITSPDQYNELGWGINDDSYYMDSTVTSFTCANRTWTKEYGIPCLAGGILIHNYDGRGNDWWNTILVSTSPTATDHYISNIASYNRQHNVLVYNEHTWYWSGGLGAYQKSGSVMPTFDGIEYIGGFDNFEDAAKWLIDNSGVYFDEYQDTFTQVGTPLSGHLFVGGGEESDYSDATFDVETDGTIHGKELQVGSTTTVNDTTWAKKMDYQEITSAAYNQLTPTQKQNVTFFITDVDSNTAGTVYSGMSEPNSVIGQNNCLYMQYDSNYNIVGFYGKINGTWTPISTGKSGSELDIHARNTITITGGVTE